MKGFLIGVLTIAAIPILAVLWWMSTYNNFVKLDEGINGGIAQVQVVLKRQADLIPNLAATVEKQASGENQILKDIAEARSKAGGVINIDPAKIAADPALQQKMLEAGQSLSGSLGRLLMVQERYPQLSQAEGFKDLRAELAGSQNRVAHARRQWQLTVKEYNTARRGFLGSYVAEKYDFKAKAYYEADAASQETPRVYR